MSSQSSPTRAGPSLGAGVQGWPVSVWGQGVRSEGWAQLEGIGLGKQPDLAGVRTTLLLSEGFCKIPHLPESGQRFLHSLRAEVTQEENALKGSLTTPWNLSHFG